jgi:hydroxymethylpyrimidine/phosphomethylpyrimidine kinase
MTERFNPPVALTIAGVDSGGAAGVAADLGTFQAHQVYGAVAVTALTAQDTKGVHGVHAVPADFLRQQVMVVLGDFPVRAVKTGMLANVEIVAVVTALAAEGALPSLVVDPVMVASSGDPLLEGDAVGAYRQLIAQALVVTPNLPEASMLLGREVDGLESMAEAARALGELGSSLVVVKGGHLLIGSRGPGGDEAAEAVDVVWDGEAVTILRGPAVETSNVHGSGCTLSAAITAHLARGAAPLDAVVAAKDYVGRAIAGSAAWQLGQGHGPLDRLYTLAHLA